MKEITAKQARIALRDCTIRYMPDRVEIQYEGRWRILGSTDLCDDVRTYSAHVPRPMFGARITPRGFWVIDSGSDG